MFSRCTALRDTTCYHIPQNKSSILLDFCNISLCVFRSWKFLWSVAISMVLIYIDDLWEIFLSFFVRGVAVFKGFKIKQFLLIVNLGRVR